MYPSIQLGLLTELQCQLTFSNYGILLSQPIINDSRYDFIADINGKLIKIQCKTCYISDDESYIAFNTASKNWNTKEYHYYSEDEIDYFFTWYKTAYLIPVQEVSGRTKTLRFSTINNSGAEKITWAKDYELEKILTEHFNYNYEEKIVKQSVKVTKKCPDCGTPIARSSNRCLTCSRKYKREIPSTIEQKISREELKEMIRTKPFTSIGEQFSVTDNAIRKWCDHYKLPRTKKDISSYSDEDWSNI